MRDRRKVWWLVIACLAACGDSNASDEPITGVAGAAGGSGANAGSIVAGAGTSSGGNVATAGVPAPPGAGAGGGGAAGVPAQPGAGTGGGGAAGSDAAAGAAGALGSDAGRGGRGGDRSQESAGAGAAGRGTGGVAAIGGSGVAGGDAMCPMRGAITYKLARSMSPTAAEQDAYDKISAAMDMALSIYNCFTNFTWTVNVQYVPSVETADGNTNGSIRFGSAESMNYLTAMHETSHTLGVGGTKYKALIVADSLFR